MTLVELLEKCNFVESVLLEVAFSTNCITLGIRIQPGLFIAPDVPNPTPLVVSFERCLFFEMERLNVTDFGEEQLFQNPESGSTITAVVENRSIIPPLWDGKYGSSINSVVIETVNLVLKIICFSISVQ